MRLIIKDTNSEIREIEVTQNMNIEIQPGQQLFFTGASSFDVSVSGDNKDVRLSLVDENGETISIGMSGLGEQISSNNPSDPFSLTTALGVSTTREGDAEIEELVNNPELEVGEMIEQLKEALAHSNSGSSSDGVMIDDFGALMDLSEVSASQGDKFNFNQFTVAESSEEDIKIAKIRASRPEDEEDNEEDEEDNEEDESEVESIIIDTTYGDDLNGDGIINQSVVDIQEASGDEIINTEESLHTTITGNIGEGGKTLDKLVVSDEAGNEVSVDLSDLIIASDGSYSVENIDLSSLNDGELTVTSNSTDIDGLKATNTDTISKDTVFGDNSDGSDEGITSDIIDSSDSGLLQTDNLTNDSTPTITGITDANSTVVITNEAGEVVGSATSDENGNYSITTIVLNEGPQDLTITATDTTGNTTETIQSIEIDTTVAIPAIVDMVDTNGDMSEILVSGTANEAGNTINLYDQSGNIVATTEVQEDGTWSADISNLTNDTDFTISATQIDTAGNESTVSTEVNTYQSDSATTNQYASDDFVFTGSGDDKIYVEEDDSNDNLVIDGGEGIDTIKFSGNDGMNVNLEEGTATVGDDTIELRNIENVYGSNSGDDTIVGSDGDNKIYGQAGDDVIDAGKGDDYIHGGSGDDTFIYNIGDGSDTIYDKSGSNNIQFGDGITADDLTFSRSSVGNDDARHLTIQIGDNPEDTITLKYQMNNNDVRDDRGVEDITFSDGTTITVDDLLETYGLTATDDSNDTSNMYASKGDDILNAGAGNDAMDAGEGDDTITGGEGDDLILGNIGTDTATYSGNIDDYTVEKNINGLITITDNRDGSPDGTDTLDSIEFIQFSDIKVSTATPDAPTVDLVETSDTGILNTDNNTADTTPTFNVTLTSGLVAGYVVTLSTGESHTLTQEDITNGSVAITVKELADDNYTVTATISSLLDFQSNDSNTVEITIDTQTSNDINITDESGDNIINSSETSNSDISGNVEVGSTINELTITDGTNTVIVDIADITLNADGSYSIDDVDLSSLNDGELTTTVTSTDIAGNQSSSDNIINKDTVFGDNEDGNDEGVSANIIDASDTGDLQTDNLTNDTTPTITGTTDAGAKVVITDEDGKVIGEVTADENGNYTVTTSELSEGTQDLTITATDTTGNETVTTQNITIDTQTSNDINITDESGDNIINSSETSNSDISGNVEVGSTINELTITDGTNTVIVDIADITLNADGSYSIDDVDLSSLNDGELTTTITSTDIAGNQSSSDNIINKDTVFGDNEDGNDEGVSANIIDASDTGDSQIDNLTNDTTPTITGTTDAGAKVVITDEDGKVIGEVTADENGNYTVITSELLEGTQDLTITATDTTGNETATTQNITVDTTSSNVDQLSITNIIDNNGDHTSITMHGTGAEPGNKITLYDEDNNAVATTTVLDDGTWNTNIQSLDDTPINDNEFFSVTETDIAGNETAQTDTTHFNAFDWETAQTDNFDDFAMAGSGDDKISVNDDDLNDQVVIDGGDGNDTVIFSGERSDYTITQSNNGDIIVTENASTDSDANGVGDINVLRNIESFTFADGTFDSENIFITTNNDTAITDEDSSVTIDVLANDNEVQNEVLSIKNIENPVMLAGIAVGIAVVVTDVLGNQQIKFTPNDEMDKLDDGEEADISFRYTVENENGGESTSRVNIKVTGTNDGPIVAEVDLGSTLEDTAIIITQEQLLSNSSDVDTNDTLSVDNVTIDAQYGIIVDNEDGTYTLTPSQDYNANDVAINFTVSDGTVDVNTTAHIDIVAVNDTTIIEGSKDVHTFDEESGTAVVVNDSITLTDVDDENLESAIITIENFVAGEDTLVFLNQNGISGSFDENTGVLTLNGTASKEDYEEALESIQYDNTNSNPDLSTREITFSVNDGDDNSTTITNHIEIGAFNDAPTLSVDSIDNFEINKDSDGYLTMSLNSSDTDSDIDFFTVSNLPENGTLYLDSNLTIPVVAGDQIDVDDASSTSVNVYFVPNFGEDLDANDFGETWFDDNAISFSFTSTDTGLTDATGIELGAKTSSEAIVNITVDDVPFTVNDITVEVTENDLGEETNSISGNVLDNDYNGDDGAVVHQVTYTNSDGTTGTAKIGEETTTQDGILVVNEDGSFTFTPDSNLDHTEGDLTFSFDYNTIDGDGDISNTSSQTITIHDGNDLTIGETQDTTIDESNLDSGSDTNSNGQSVSGTLSISTGSDSVDVRFDTTQVADGSYDKTVTTNQTVEDPEAMETDGWSKSGDDWVKTETSNIEIEGKTILNHGSKHDFTNETDGDLTVDVKLTGNASGVAIVTYEDGSIATINLVHGENKFDNADSITFETTGKSAIHINSITQESTVVTAATQNDIITKEVPTGSENVPETTDLTHDGIAITYAISEDGRTLTGVAGDTDVFKVELADPTADESGSYTFTLLDSIDHQDGDVSLEELNIPFNIIATDIDGDSVTGSFSVKVLDDEPIETNGYVINEDGDVSFNISADTVSLVTFDGVEHGTATYDETTGEITYTPDADFSGFENFTYTTTDADGDTVTSTITVDVKPIVDDATNIEGSASGDEDSWIELEINKPEVGDSDSETLSDITISRIPNGAELRLEDGTAVEIINGKAVISVDDVDNLEIKAPQDSNIDFKLSTKFTVTDTAINSDGETITNSKNFTSKVKVNVSGVADDTDIEAQNASASEQGLDENLFDIKDLVSNVNFGDTDGSETHSITIDNLPAGTQLNSGTATITQNDDGTFKLVVNNDGIDDVQLQFTNTAEGDYNLTLQSSASENDGDVSNSEVVTANLHIDPSAGEIEFDVDTVTGLEDSIIALDIDITNANPDSDGSEKVTGIEIAGIPVGATILDGEGNVLFTSTQGDTTATLDLDSTEIEGLQVQAPQNDSSVINLEIRIESTDGDVVSYNESQELQVIVEADVDNSVEVGDVTGLEDTAISLGANYIDLDDSETGSVVLTGAIIGTTITYTQGDEEVSVVISSDDQKVVLDASDVQSLELTAPKDFSGTLDLNMETTIVDTQGLSADIKTTSTDFQVNVTGDADTPILTVSGASGDEDSAIDLNIGAGLRDVDGSETLSVTVEGMPEGAVLSAGTNNGDGTWTLQADDLEGLQVTPPENSNIDFELNITATSEENDGDSASTSLVLPVSVTGVADEATISASGTGVEDNHISLDLDTVNNDADSENLSYMISDVPNDVTLYRVDENGDAVKIDDGEFAKIGEFAGFGEDGGTNWIISADDLDNIVMIPSSDFSGTISMNFNVTSQEDDGDLNTVSVPLNVEVTPELDTELKDFNVVGTEDTWISITNTNNGLSNSGEDNEIISDVTIENLPDGAAALGVKVEGQYVELTANDDGSYSLSPEQIDAGVAVLPVTDSDVDFDLSITRTITDTTDDGTNLENDVRTETTSINVNVIGDSDSLDSLDVTSSIDMQDGTGEVAVDSIITNVSHSDNDGSESHYYVIQNDSSSLDNTSWTVTGEGVINAGNGTFIITDPSTANIQVVDPTSGDGSLNLQITPFVVESEGDILEDSANIQTFSVNYEVGGTNLTSDAPSLDVDTNDINGIEDQNINDNLLEVTSDGNVAYIIQDVDHGSIYGNDLYNGADGSNCNPDGLFQLPDGSFVTIDMDSVGINPQNDFSGDITLDVQIVATGENGAETIVNKDVSIEVDAVTDGFKIGSDGKISGAEDSEIDLGIVLTQIDNDGSESIVGDMVIVSVVSSSKDENGNTQYDATTDKGEINYTGTETFIDNGDGTYTVSIEALDNITFKAPQDSHGTFTIKVDLEAKDGDAESINQSKIFKVKVNSQVDDISLDTIDNNLEAQEGVDSISLGLTSTLSDDDGSEVGYIEISGVPDGATLSHGFAQINDDGSSTWRVPQSQAGNVELIPESHFSSDTFTLSVEAKVLDVASKQFNVSEDSVDINITIDPVANEVILQESNAAGDEDSSINLNLNVSMEDIDGSETLSVEITDLPDGSIIELNGVEYQEVNGSVSLDGLSINDTQNVNLLAPEHVSGNFELGLTVHTVDSVGNLTNISSDLESTTINVEVQSVASDFANNSNFNVSVGDYSATAVGLMIPVVIEGIELNDTDGSENLTINISGLGDGAIVTYNDNGNTKIATLDSDGNFSIELNPAQNPNYQDIVKTIEISSDNADDLEGDLQIEAVATDISTGESHTLSRTNTIEDFISDATISQTNFINIDSVGDSIQLNIELPNGLDNNEKLGSINLNIQGNMKLTNENDEVISDSLSSGVNIVIVNDDGSINENIHPFDQNTENMITMTENEFNNLQVVSDTDITGSVTIDTTYNAFEVDNSNNTIVGIDPVTTTHSEVIDVDDTITYDENSTIDAGVGFDTLEIDHEDIDLSKLTESIMNIEVIDMDNGIDQTLKADLDSIIDITDVDQDLIFIGDDGDVIDFGTSEEWTKSDTDTIEIDGVDGDFTEYVSSTNSDVSIFVDEDISVITTDF